MVTLSWVVEYIPTFVAIFHTHTSLFRLSIIFKQNMSVTTSIDQGDK